MDLEVLKMDGNLVGPTFRLTQQAEGYYLGDTIGGDGYDVIEDWVKASRYSTPSGYTNSLRTDKRGVVRFKTGWVWAIGKTFHSGYLNIPVNLFYSSGREGGYIGLSMGFNIAKKD